jgi:ubiquinone/menaquinone biosynthesis C-methylase UbiE
MQATKEVAVEMKEYYRRRAKGYDEELYQTRADLARQEELQSIADVSREALKARRVLDVACGTGYWTEIVSETARSIVGADIAKEMLEIARGKQFKCPVSFCRADVFNLPFKNVSFNGGMADFWFSHIPREKIESFLEDFHCLLESGSLVLVADNVYIAGIGGEFVKKEGDVNTYKRRKLGDGSEHLVLKNYFSSGELTEIFARHVRGFGRKNVFYGKYYWYLFYELK